DTCSAPGGKTTHMATLMQNKGKIIACDIYEHKLKLIQDNANRLGINIIEPKLLDAREIGNQYKNQADKVLVDAPCSGMGVLRRKPDSRWNKTAEIFEELPPLQLAILESAALAVKPQGVLVYSTCTIMPQENIEIINQFLAKHLDFVLEDIRKYLPFKTKNKEKTLQLMPYKDNTDGFFIARMYKKV
ncbi:MAG: methyltransferase domain-containing protein, partial [Megamonas funiformis]|uniref:methyltransferase domain-containing protein n=1 Tax=Megamonas funiformis TaxID=437897 RepID=UPI0039958D4C